MKGVYREVSTIERPDGSETNQQTSVALLHYYDLIEDFLETLNLSLDSFCDEFVGSWLFGYIDALHRANLRTILFCISSSVTQPTRRLHRPTGATICFLPATRSHQLLRTIARYFPHKPWHLVPQKQLPPSDVRGLMQLPQGFFRSVKSYCATPFSLLLTELQREHCKVVLCQEYEYPRSDLCAFWGKRKGLSVFATFQGGDRTQNILESPLRRLALPQYAGVIIAPQAEIERVSHRYGLPAHKMARILNPLNLEQWKDTHRQQARLALQIPETAKVVVWHGRVEIERKGLDILLNAWEILCKKYPDQDFHLLMVGTGRDAPCLEILLQSCCLKRVSWLNTFVSDRAVLKQYLAAADLYVLPSRLEGFPVAPLEAMACGLPIVVSQAAGMSDFLQDGTPAVGVVVPTADAIALAEAIEHLFENPDKRAQMAQLAKAKIEQTCSAEAIGQQLKQFLFSTTRLRDSRSAVD
jgi:starch synthase